MQGLGIHINPTFYAGAGGAVISYYFAGLGIQIFHTLTAVPAHLGSRPRCVEAFFPKGFQVLLWEIRSQIKS